MAEVFHERLKSPIPTMEMERRAKTLQEKMKEHGIDCVLAQNVTQYLGGCNRWLTDTTAENNYPQSTILPQEGGLSYIACSGPPLDSYPPAHMIRGGSVHKNAPYFSPFNFTHDWEGKAAAEWAINHSVKKMGIVGWERFYWNYYDYLKKNLPNVELVDASFLFDEIRAQKSAAEIAFLEKSAVIQDKAMGYLPAICQPGVREYEIRSQVMKLLTDLGGEEQIVLIGSAPKGERFSILPSFFQNRSLEKGDQLYIKLSSSGPGGFFTSIGRMFSIGCPPAASLEDAWQKTLAAQKYLTEKLQIGADPQLLFDDYNGYLQAQGCAQEEGLFAYGQGYDHVERPSLQPGETMRLTENMCLAVNTNWNTVTETMYCSDSFLLKPQGAQRMHQTPQIIFQA